MIKYFFEIVSTDETKRNDAELPDEMNLPVDINVLNSLYEFVPNYGYDSAEEAIEAGNKEIMEQNLDPLLFKVILSDSTEHDEAINAYYDQMDIKEKLADEAVLLHREEIDPQKKLADALWEKVKKDWSPSKMQKYYIMSNGKRYISGRKGEMETIIGFFFFAIDETGNIISPTFISDLNEHVNLLNRIVNFHKWEKCEKILINFLSTKFVTQRYSTRIET